MNLVGTEIGFARRILSQLLSQPLELAPAHIGQILARGRCCRSLVQVYRNLQLASDALTELTRECDAIFHRRALERNERDDVGGTDPRVFAAVLTEIDALRRRLD